MRNTLRFGLRGRMLPVPALVWRRMVAREGRRTERQLSFMTPAHHRVRNFVVERIGATRQALSLEEIADATGIARERLDPIVDELERERFFLYRDATGRVEWAYPVTAANTPHHLAFESGERMTAA